MYIGNREIRQESNYWKNISVVDSMVQLSSLGRCELCYIQTWQLYTVTVLHRRLLDEILTVTRCNINPIITTK